MTSTRPRLLERRVFLCGAASLAALAVPGRPRAQPAGSVARVGFLTGGGSFKPDVLRALADAGWTDGQNLRFETRAYGDRLEERSALAAELVALKSDVILATSPYGIAAAKAATTTIPIVGVDFESDPVASRFVESLARPGGNLTGVFLDVPELAGKLVQLIVETVPGLRRVGVLWNGDIGQLQFAAVEAAARRSGLVADSLSFRRRDDLAPAVDRARRQRDGALVVLSAPVVSFARAQIADIALRHRLPSIAMFPHYVDAGGLLAYGPDQAGMFRTAAALVDRILRGARPAEMPVERPTRFELVANARTAKALGLVIPPVVLSRADRVVD